MYRHFPDDEALFGACSSHWAAANPLTEQMMENLLRDEQTVATVKRLFSAYHQYVAAAREILVRGRPERGRRRDATRAAIGHALAFATWQSLTREQGLERSRAADLACAMVAGAARG